MQVTYGLDNSLLKQQMNKLKIDNKAIDKIINAIYSILAIGICLLLGYSIKHIMGGLPPSLYGMIIFTVLLHNGMLNEQKVKESIAWGIRHMGICFIPAGVGMINHYQLVKQHGLMLVVITFLTTFFLLTAVGLFFEKNQ